MRLIDHLKTRDLTNRQARAAMESGKVWVGGIPMCDAGREVDPALVEVRPQAPRIKVGRDVVVIWRDEHMAVLWKPSRMLSVPAPRRVETNVLAEVGRVLGPVLPVHRLDEATSGLMMVARTAPAQDGLKALLEIHDVERRYLAIVQRRLPSEAMTIETVLVRNRGDGRRGSDPGNPQGKRACTHVRMLERLGPFSLVEARLETGRTHQVRIHLSEHRCAILGDALYGGRGLVRRAPRLALHAAVLGFVHPITGAVVRFEAPLADDLEQLRRQLAASVNERPRRRSKRKRGSRRG